MKYLCRKRREIFQEIERKNEKMKKEWKMEARKGKEKKRGIKRIGGNDPQSDLKK